MIGLFPTVNRVLEQKKAWLRSRFGFASHPTTAHYCTCEEKALKGRMIDPTRTSGIRLAFTKELETRFRRISRLLEQVIVERDVFGLGVTPSPLRTLSPMPQRRAYQFLTTPEKQTAFMEWLRGEVDRGVLQVYEGRNRPVVGNVPWANMYIDSAYKKGMQRSKAELVKAGITPSLINIKKSPYAIDAAFNTPFHAERVAQIYTRVYSSLKNVTDDMEAIISYRLAEGLAEGRNPKQIAQILRKTIERAGKDLAIKDALGRQVPALTRARIIARTEVIRAHHVATMGNYRLAGLAGVKLKAELSTAGDDRVCEYCGGMEGKVFTLDEADSLIPLHPQCRCVMLPTDINDKGEVDKAGVVEPVEPVAVQPPLIVRPPKVPKAKTVLAKPPPPPPVEPVEVPVPPPVAIQPPPPPVVVQPPVVPVVRPVVPPPPVVPPVEKVKKVKPVVETTPTTPEGKALKNGTVVRQKRLGEDDKGVNASFKIDLVDEKGNTTTAAVKWENGEYNKHWTTVDAKGFTSAMREKVVQDLDHALGIDMVPPVEYRKIDSIPFMPDEKVCVWRPTDRSYPTKRVPELKGWASVMQWKKGLRAMETNLKLNVMDEFKATVLDIVAGSGDRHGRNYLIEATTTTTTRIHTRTHLIDNGLSMSKHVGLGNAFNKDFVEQMEENLLGGVGVLGDSAEFNRILKSVESLDVRAFTQTLPTRIQKALPVENIEALEARRYTAQEALKAAKSWDSIRLQEIGSSFRTDDALPGWEAELKKHMENWRKAGQPT